MSIGGLFAWLMYGIWIDEEDDMTDEAKRPDVPSGAQPRTHGRKANARREPPSPRSRYELAPAHRCWCCSWLIQGEDVCLLDGYATRADCGEACTFWQVHMWAVPELMNRVERAADARDVAALKWLARFALGASGWEKSWEESRKFHEEGADA